MKTHLIVLAVSTLITVPSLALVIPKRPTRVKAKLVSDGGRKVLMAEGKQLDDAPLENNGIIVCDKDQCENHPRGTPTYIADGYYYSVCGGGHTNPSTRHIWKVITREYQCPYPNTDTLWQSYTMEYVQEGVVECGTTTLP